MIFAYLHIHNICASKSQKSVIFSKDPRSVKRCVAIFNRDIQEIWCDGIDFVLANKPIIMITYIPAQFVHLNHYVQDAPMHETGLWAINKTATYSW